MAGHRGQSAAWFKAAINKPHQDVLSGIEVANRSGDTSYTLSLNKGPLAFDVKTLGLNLDDQPGPPEKVAEHNSGFTSFLGSTSGRIFSHSEPKVALDNYIAALREIGSTLNNAPVNWPEQDTEDGKLKVWENLRIPAGYTYLLQLMAHDMVDSDFGAEAMVKMRLTPENMRRSKLRLETIYGGGPEMDQSIYWPEPDGKGPRCRLSLGRIQPMPGQADKASCPFRDIARRTHGEVPESGNGGSDHQQSRLTEIDLADPRNDDNAVLSQLVTLFHIAHNGIVKQLLDIRADMNSSEGKLFLVARTILTLIYRRIIRQDVLRRILHPAIFDLYVVQDFRLKKETSQYTIPVEFTHGAFRFAHAMVRPRYKLNMLPTTQVFTLAQVLGQNSNHSPGRMPFTQAWITDWSLFFPVNPVDLSREDKRPLYSRKLIAPYTPTLLQDVQLNNIANPYGGGGMFLIDLMSHALIRCKSLDAILETITEYARAHGNEGEQLIKLLPKTPFEKLKIEDLGLVEPTTAAKAAAQTFLDLVGNEIPLPLFVLMEAKQFSSEHLGIIGSIIVAETIIGVLDADPVTDMEGGSTTSEQISKICIMFGYSKDQAEALVEKLQESLQDQDWNRPSDDGPGLVAPPDKHPREIVTMAQLVRLTDRIRDKQFDQLAFASLAQ